ncbi:hypothetical protein GCM10028812_53500 [Ancylobacter sonchi]
MGHYEFSRYGKLKRWAQNLELKDAVALLDATVQDETKTDKALFGQYRRRQFWTFSWGQTGANSSRGSDVTILSPSHTSIFSASQVARATLIAA